MVRCRFSYGVRTGITVNNKNFIGRAFQKIESRFGERVQIVAVIFNLETGFEEFGFILEVCWKTQARMTPGARLI